MKEKYIEDLASIRSIMERSNRMLSLSGLSGVLAGIFALAGATYSYYLIYYPNLPIGYRSYYINDLSVIYKLIFAAALVLALSLTFGLILTLRKAKRKQLEVWNKQSLRLLVNLGIPLIAGGSFILCLVYRGQLNVVAPAMLIFYGLALVNGSHYTFGDIRNLGYCEIVLGIAAAALPGFGLIFWTLGFGILHIIYGIAMYIKYDK